MANQIGSFHESLPDHAQAVKGTASHIRRFWDPRMRRAIFDHLDHHKGEGLSPLVLEALNNHRAELTPPPPRQPQPSGKP
jgi:formate dehydrogenase subunit delta